MRLRAALTILAAAAGWAASASPALDADETVERYLEARDLRSLLLDHLQAMLERAPVAQRADVAERLASLYADELERARTPEARAALEDRARSLLDGVPEAESFDLRLNLLRAAYARAEETAERVRLGAASPAEAKEAERALRAVLADCERIGAAAHRRVELLQQQEEAARDLDLDLLREALASARRQRSLAMYFAGWSGVYLAELVGDSPEAGPLAAEAALRFGWLLNAEPGKAPTLERLPPASLRFEHVARAAVGVATAASLRGDYAAFLRWIEAVEANADTPQPVRDQLFARRAAAASRAGEWIDLLRLVRAVRGVDTPLPTSRMETFTPLEAPEARLLAVIALGARPPARSAAVVETLRQIALADLVARDELGHVLDLTMRHGADALPREGFIASHVRGLLAFQRARAAHRALPGADAEAPTADPAVAAQYREALALLRSAAGAGDADRFPRASAEAALAAATAQFFAAGAAAEGSRDALLRAADLFDEAARVAQGSAVADARWMAVRALELAAQGPGEPPRAVLQRRDRAAETFLRQFPEDDRAASLLLTQSASGRLAPREAAEALLRTPPGSPAYGAARREAARLLFNLFRAAPDAEKNDLGARFVAVAEPLLRDELRAAAGGEREAAARAVVLARQTLDAILSARTPDARRAESVLQAILGLEAAGLASLDAVRGEILFRRAQVALAVGDPSAAANAAEELAALASPDAPRFASAAVRLLYRDAATAWRSGRRTEEGARLVLRYGARTLQGVAGDAPIDPATRASIQTVMAEAGAWLWTSNRDADARDAALRMARAALEVRPDEASLLRLAAGLALDAGDARAAFDAWRRLASGADVGSAAWFEARFHTLAALRAIDPERARDELDAHVALHPDYGPAPWGERLRELHRALGGPRASQPPQP